MLSPRAEPEPEQKIILTYVAPVISVTKTEDALSAKYKK